MSKNTDLIIIETGGKSYLGNLVEGDTVKIENALVLSDGELYTSTLQDWLAKKELEELSQRTIKGAIGFTTTPLSRELLNDLKILEGHMADAHKYAETRMIVQEFHNLCDR